MLCLLYVALPWLTLYCHYKWEISSRLPFWSGLRIFHLSIFFNTKKSVCLNKISSIEHICLYLFFIWKVPWIQDGVTGGNTSTERQNSFWICLSLKDKMETHSKFPTVQMNVSATKLFSDVSFSDVFFSVSFEICLSPLASENKLPRFEISLQIMFSPSQKCQTQSLNEISEWTVIRPPKVREAISTKMLKLRPWVKDLRSE